MEDLGAVERMIAESDLIFCTPPCKESAAKVVPADKKQQEVFSSRQSVHRTRPQRL
jgi:hypothetical protein